MHLRSGYVYLHKDMLLLCVHVWQHRLSLRFDCCFSLWAKLLVIQWMPCVNTRTTEPWTENLQEKVSNGLLVFRVKRWGFSVLTTVKLSDGWIVENWSLSMQKHPEQTESEMTSILFSGSLVGRSSFHWSFKAMLASFKPWNHKSHTIHNNDILWEWSFKF